ncbi:MAG: PASTA domain-containing protein [Candidatus Zixiibacteriota bacterium]
MTDSTPHIPRPGRIRRETGSNPNSGADGLLANPRIRVAAVILLGVLGLFAFAVIVDKIIMPWLTRQGEEFELVDLSGMNVDKARDLLEEQGLTLEVTSEEYNPSYDDGAVLNQYPLAGTKVKSGRLIKVVISLGEKDVIIPLVAGVSVRQAKLDIETAGLRIGDIAWTYTDTLPEKLVVFTFPAAGDTVSIGSQVNLLVNRGRGQGVTFMPNLIGMTLEEAKDLLRKKGLRVGLVMTRRDENFLPETVLEQSEDEATELEVGEEVDLVVSTTE